MLHDYKQNLLRRHVYLGKKSIITNTIKGTGLASSKFNQSYRPLLVVYFVYNF